MAGGLEYEENQDPPKQVPNIPHITGNMITITDPDVKPKIYTAALAEAKIGLPVTPEKK